MVCVFLVKKMSAFGLSSVSLVVCPVDTLYKLCVQELPFTLFRQPNGYNIIFMLLTNIDLPKLLWQFLTQIFYSES